MAVLRVVRNEAIMVGLVGDREKSRAGLQGGAPFPRSVGLCHGSLVFQVNVDGPIL
jgi:hypothetical protein